MTDRWIIKRTDQDHGYVADLSLTDHSYTHKLELARIYPTREEAWADQCVGNEIIVSLDDVLQGLDPS